MFGSMPPPTKRLNLDRRTEVGKSCVDLRTRLVEPVRCLASAAISPAA